MSTRAALIKQVQETLTKIEPEFIRDSHDEIQPFHDLSLLADLLRQDCLNNNGIKYVKNLLKDGYGV